MERIHIIDDWFLSADRYTFVLERRAISESGKEYYTEGLYPATLAQAAKILFDRKLRNANVQTLAELGERMEQIKAEIEESFGEITPKEVFQNG